MGVAISEMDSVTQQNAALVEEISAAAAALEGQTAEAVAKFHLSEHIQSAREMRGTSNIQSAAKKNAVAKPAVAADDWVSF